MLFHLFAAIRCLYPVLEAMARMSFNHLFSLSLSFHTRRKTGEITDIITRGAVADELYNNFFFYIGPAYIDLFIAVGVFLWLFDWVLAATIFAVEIAYGKFHHTLSVCH